MKPFAVKPLEPPKSSRAVALPPVPPPEVAISCRFTLPDAVAVGTADDAYSIGSPLVPIDPAVEVSTIVDPETFTAVVLASVMLPEALTVSRPLAADKAPSTAGPLDTFSDNAGEALLRVITEPVVPCV